MSLKIWHPFTQHAIEPVIPTITRASGATLFDKDNRVIIDAISSWWVQTHGHCHPHISRAIQKQAETLDQIIFAGYSHEPAERLAHMLRDFFPSSLEHIFFSDSGSTAVEVAIKMALGARYNKSDARQKILVMEHSYHGDTVGAMSLGERSVFNAAYRPLLFDVEYIPFPQKGAEDAAINALLKACNQKDNAKPAAFILEPLILGAGGMKIYSASCLRQIAGICQQYDITLIIDEVMTGWGRTGTIFAYEQAGITPDIICIAKGLTGGSVPLAATLCNAPIYKAFYSQDPSKMFFHSSSFTANPINCAAAIANLEIWQEGDVHSKIHRIMAQHEAFAKKIAPYACIGNIRQLGTILAFDIQMGEAGYTANIGRELRQFYASRNILLRPLGNVVYIMPPYAITQDELNTVYAAIVESLERLTHASTGIGNRQ